MKMLRDIIDRVRAAYWNWRFARMEHVTPESLGLPSVVAPPRPKRALVVTGGQRGGAVAAAVAAMTGPKEPPLRAYKDGAIMRGRAGEVYELSNVDPAVVTGSVGATLRRLDKTRNNGLSGRQKKRQRVAQRRRVRDREFRQALTSGLREHTARLAREHGIDLSQPLPIPSIEHAPEAARLADEAEARRLAGCE